MLKTGALVARHGLKKGLSKAASRVAPPLAILEAAVEVLRAGGAIAEWYAASKHHEGLQKMVQSLGQQLRLEREALDSAIQEARKEAEVRQDAARAVHQLLRAAHRLVGDASKALSAAQQEDLPDFTEVERLREELEDAWAGLRRALEASRRL
jgi:nitric oxide reductase large subunit